MTAKQLASQLKDMKENGLDGLISVEDYLLAQAQNW